MKKRLFAAVLSLALMCSFVPPAAALDVEEARDLLEQYYVDQLPPAALQAETVEELLAALSDPYTVYYTPEQLTGFLSGVNGESVVGIGVSIQKDFIDGFEVMSVLPNSPALEMGLQPGDKVIGVDGVPLTATDSVSDRIGGEEGTAVTVTIRTPEGQVRDITMNRRRVLIPILTYEQVGAAGIIRCDSFGETAPSDTRQALVDLDKNTAVWIMDLRYNPGGTSQAASGMAGAFVGGRTMAYFRDASGGYYYTGASPYALDQTDKPLIILTSPQSASGSELFTAAIRDHMGGIAIGSRTYGKGIAQTIYDQDMKPGLFEGDALKITTHRFFSPDGATNHIVGVIPTLMMDPNYAQAAARMLSGAVPKKILNAWRVEIYGHTFYLDVDLCREWPEVLCQLLEALPLGARIYHGMLGERWDELTPAETAEFFQVESYTPRTFRDVKGHEYEWEINTLATLGLLAGDGAGEYHPQEDLTRGELATMLAGALNLPVSEITFTDVAADAWYAPGVSAVAARGFMAGNGDGTFSPDKPLTRQEFYTVLSAVAAWCSMEGDAWAQKELSMAQWGDFYEYPQWAQTSARNLEEMGLKIEHTEPEALVTRGQAAGQFGRLLDRMHMLWVE